MGKRSLVAGLTVLLANGPSIGDEIKETSRYTQGKTYHVPKNRLVKYLSDAANDKEFQVAYLPREETLIDFSVKRSTNESELDIDKLDSLISQGEEFYLIHNHNNIDLDPRKDEINQLYWLAPSKNDVRQYMSIGHRGANFRYGIITEYGLLTMKTDKDTFASMNNPYFAATIGQEAYHAQTSLIGVNADGLQTWAENYRGILGLSFEKAK